MGPREESGSKDASCVFRTHTNRSDFIQQSRLGLIRLLLCKRSTGISTSFGISDVTDLAD